MTMHPLSEISEHDFEARVLASPVPVLVDFTATWCGPCRLLTPILEKLALERAGQLGIVKVDGDSSPSIAARYNVRAFPTVIAFAGGKEIARHMGLTTREKLLRLVEARLAPAAPAP